jgi:hypothetical protein
MEWLIWVGAGLTLAGVAGIVWSIVLVARARKAGLGEEALRARLQAVLPLNVGALLGSMLGLALVIVGVILS